MAAHGPQGSLHTSLGATLQEQQFAALGISQTMTALQRASVTLSMARLLREMMTGGGSCPPVPSAQAVAHPAAGSAIPVRAVAAPLAGQAQQDPVYELLRAELEVGAFRAVAAAGAMREMIERVQEMQRSAAMEQIAMETRGPALVPAVVPMPTAGVEGHGTGTAAPAWPTTGPGNGWPAVPPMPAPRPQWPGTPWGL